MNRDTGETFLKFFNKVLNHLCSLAFLTRSSKWPADNKADHRVTVLEAGDDIQHFIRRKCPDGIGNGTEKIRPCHTHARSEEHTSELQSRGHIVCRLPLEKKNYANKSIDQSKQNGKERI